MEIFEWLSDHEMLLAILGGSGLLLFVGTLLAIPIIIAYMPEDYFVRIARGNRSRNPFRHFLHILKNILGAFLMVAGVIMLLLPGQGILTIVIGFSLVDFPGKQRLQLRTVQLPKIRQSIEWIRQKVHHKPLLIP